MNVKEKIVATLGVNRLKMFCFKEQDNKNFTTYLKFLPPIEECYQSAFYWHGTGRYHYKYSGDSKYEGTHTNDHLDVLKSIINSNGLVPRYDPWIKADNAFKDSISLTPFRMYARVYAEFHQNEKEPLQYEYGNPKYWFIYLGLLQVLEKKPFRNLTNALRMKYTKSFVKRSQTWMNTIRADLTHKPLNPSKLYLLRSDIPHNYGILFGIKKGSVNPIDLDPIVGRFETRSDKPITFDDITHIEVPLANLEETITLLKENNINIKVIPIEYGEIYCNKYSFQELSGIR